MKTVLASLAAVAALAAVATPAAAQGYYRHGGDWTSVNERQARIDAQIDRGVRTGQLTPREAGRLRYEFRDIQHLEARYRRDGLSRWERADLDRRLDRLEMETRRERHDDQYRGERWDDHRRW